MHFALRTTLALLSAAATLPAYAATRDVGPGKPYATPCRAFAAAAAVPSRRVAGSASEANSASRSRSSASIRSGNSASSAVSL